MLVHVLFMFRYKHKIRPEIINTIVFNHTVNTLAVMGSWDS